MHHYHFSEEFVLFDLPGVRGQAYLAHAIYSGGMVDFASDGYIAQERFKEDRP